MNPSAIRILRDLVPIRPLTQLEALRIAELQATRLLALSGVKAPAVPEAIITELPKIEVRRVRPWPSAGCTDWVKSTWVIVLNAADIPARQRFTLTHEFKHILDDRFVKVIYPNLPTMSSKVRAERACDYFAGCLLVPKLWLRQAWTSGIQQPAALAHHFGVSESAIATRLSQTGLVDPKPRCDFESNPVPRRYYRQAGLAAGLLGA